MSAGGASLIKSSVLAGSVCSARNNKSSLCMQTFLYYTQHYTAGCFKQNIHHTTMYYTIHTFIILLHSRTWALNNPSYDYPAVRFGLVWPGWVIKLIIIRSLIWLILRPIFRWNVYCGNKIFLCSTMEYNIVSFCWWRQIIRVTSIIRADYMRSTNDGHFS